ncbi:hypothetical protein E0494_02410 [Marinilabiliaceae bacterium JC040]|nr:hypothetical protein [Marinilabiliaceae bacterium JC040]
MSKYSIYEIITSEDVKEFLLLPVRLYKESKKWVRPLDEHIENIFDRSKNHLFENGEAIRYLLKDEKGETIGRIAAFIDYSTCNSTGIKVGGIGFFECIDNYQAAEVLFNAAKQWLKDRKMEALDGPINFGPRNENWGLLVDGDYTPNFGMPYNHFYYRGFFERYGFKTYFKQYTYRTFFLESNLNKLIVWKAERLLKNPSYTVKMYSEIPKENVINDFVDIYNKAWVGDIPGVEAIGKRDGEMLYAQLSAILDPQLMYFAYYNDQPIGFFIMIPDLNNIIKRLGGKFNLISKIKYQIYKKIYPTKKALGQIFGVIPEFQSRGVDAALIYSFCKKGLNKNFPYNELEMNWIGDFNPRMMHMMEYIGAEKYKTHITYRLMIDSTKDFEPCPTT